MKKLLLVCMFCFPIFLMGQKACNVYEKVKFVEYGEDYKVKFVKYNEDLSIKYVSYGKIKLEIGKWLNMGKIIN